MKLTDQRIRGLPFTDTGQHDHVDDVVRGLAVRVGRRTKTFVLVTGAARSRKRHTLGHYDPPHFTLAKAREKARDILAAERLRKEETPRTTFEQALETYYRAHVSKLRRSSQRAIRQTIDRHFRTKLAKKIITDIKPTDIAPLLDTMLDTPTEMHNAFIYLGMFFNWCMRRGYIEIVPTVRMDTPVKPASRERVLSPDELAAIWHAADPQTDYGRIIRLSILSGQRIGQWAGARREYIGTETVTWPADVMKGNRSHMLPLTPTIRKLLPDRIGLLFPNENGVSFSNWGRSKARLDRDSAVSSFTHHDIRRTWATVCAEQLAIDPHIIESALAHVIGTRVSRTYNRARYLEPIRKAIVAFEEWLYTLLQNTEAKDDRHVS
jgi:integrase